MICPACDHDNIPGEDLCVDCGLDLAGLDVQAWGVSPDDPLLKRDLASLPLKEPLTCILGRPVTEAIELMQERGEGCVFAVRDDGKLEGVLTERDVTVRIAAVGRDPRVTKLDEVMTPRPVSLQQTDSIAWALHRMGVDGFRHLPVMDGDRLVGFLSARTVLRVLLDA